MTMKHSNIILLISVLISFSCDSQNEQGYDKKAIALNNYATELMLNKPDSALLLLNEATEIDPDYYLAHNNKINLFITKGEIDKAIRSAEKSVELKPNIAEAVIMLGMLYDYNGNTDKAKEQYSKALDIFKKRLETSDKNKFENRLNRAYALLLLGEKKEGKTEIQKLLQENPNDYTIQILADFDKEQYLTDLFRQK